MANMKSESVTFIAGLGLSFLAAASMLVFLGMSSSAFAQPTTCLVAPEDLEGWWPADANANDIVAGNNGTLFNGVTFAAGLVDEAFDFDGVDDMVMVPDATALRPSQVTVMAWVNFTDLDGTEYGDATVYPGLQYILFKKNTRSAFFEDYALVKFRFSDGLGRFQFVASAAGGQQVYPTSSTTVVPGRWYHVAGTHDGTTARVYVDGVLENSRYHPYPLDHSPWPMVIGRSGQDGEPGESNFDGAFNGRIDEVQLYSRALSATEILAVYEAGFEGVCKDEDGDGYRPPEDCDETNASINPDGLELPGNFIDEDCNGDLGDCSPCNAWRNHGEYIRCTSTVVNVLVLNGALTEEEGDALVSSAARSDIGKRGYVAPECTP